MFELLIVIVAGIALVVVSVVGYISEKGRR